MKSNFLSLWLRAAGFPAGVGVQHGSHYRDHRAIDAATELARVRSDRDQRRTWDGTLVELRCVFVLVAFPEAYWERRGQAPTVEFDIALAGLATLARGRQVPTR